MFGVMAHCDQCQELVLLSTSVYDPSPRSRPAGWFTLRQMHPKNSEQVSGEWDFCSRKCLTQWNVEWERTADGEVKTQAVEGRRPDAILATETP